ncbi:hypothetical protein FOZ62_024594 [Perkinsus olseni]|uniref:U-box domain-containing protein n=1 Tax=Perkinsus olseni TaxID=32597 RepID=A0A7J6U0I3_PEROL|nr:hypothetical protein FOZ62_024594 [Perkinsus olseni]
MLDILAKCVGYDSLKGHHLLELTSGSLSSVVSLLSFVLRCDSGVADFELQACASRCLVELSYPECVFCREAAEMDGNATDIKKLTRKFNEHVSELICSVIEYDVVDSFGRCVCQHQRSHANTDILMKDFMTLIHNCLLYCSSHHHQLRQHLAIKSNIIPDILLPYIENILPVFTEVGSTVGAKSIEWANLTSALQTLAIVTFNVKTFRKPLQRSELLSRVAGLPQLKEAPVTMVVLMKVAINCNYGTSQHWGTFAEASGVAIEGMQEAARERVRRRVQVGSDALPVNPSGDTVPMVYSLLGVEPIDLDSPGGDEPPGEQRGGKKNGVWLTKVRRPSGDYKSRRRGRRRWKRGNPFKRVSRVMEFEDTDEDEGQQVAGPDDAEEADPGEATMYCALTGCLMRDPVKTPQGVLYERSAITDWLTSGNSTCPVSGQGLAVSDLSAAPEVLDATVGCQAEALAELAADRKSGDAEDTLPSNETTQDGNGEEVNRSLLGDLPTLQSGKQGLPSNPDKSAQAKQALRIRRTSQKLVNAPAELKCALDGKIMTNPVRSPYGHAFEKKTLEKWFDSCGEICPITEKPLNIDDCKPAQEVKKAIVRYVKEKEKQNLWSVA